MYTRNLLSYNYKSNIDSMIIRKINLIKMLFLLLLLIIFLTSIVRFYNSIECTNSSSLAVDDFKSDISMLSETVNIIKELREFQFNLRSSDHNLNNFIVITKGKYAGTILYNGPLKFIDDEHKRYFGLELCMDSK
ncbi:hypothetical protein IS491_26050 [Clostridium beijerinckii]|jgi:hypothetical protein|uniref:Uncharacterized protein n=2 Tax=Clostridium beijerinckii TaxID=1520 RepID=A0AAE2RXE3_CLOBE|nr:hypothetical protein [Clostridium beijerinckii]OOM42327.1 hypothetical protein CLOSB_39940 [Clostridium beijerinckii]OOM51752.1 hypothetical protein CLBKI_42190 [Clostridium beijerinckii]QUF75622.1 hypothetical protein KDJ94_07790 [Clostridium beijerinckii]